MNSSVMGYETPVVLCRVEAAVMAALLHDTVDDTRVSLEEIYDDFGPRVAQIVWAGRAAVHNHAAAA